jgi:hypothetical protein
LVEKNGKKNKPRNFEVAHLRDVSSGLALHGLNGTRLQRRKMTQELKRGLLNTESIKFLPSPFVETVTNSSFHGLVA